MITLIRNGEVYSPQYLGKKDILIAGQKIEYIEDHIEIPDSWRNVQIIDASDRVVTPGFIDSHVHIIGAGCEGGFHTRTPEIQLSDLTGNGITTVVGCLGTDATTRSLNSLLAKAYALQEEGISTFMYTGSYETPWVTITGNIRDDVALIEKVVGVGEVAIADDLSYQLTKEQINRVIVLGRLGGTLSNKSGLIVFHALYHNENVEYLMKINDHINIPLNQFILTHMTSTKELLKDAIQHTKNGGLVDLTTTTCEEYLKNGETRCGEALAKMMAAGCPIENITFSSDAQGSISIFNEEREFIGFEVGNPSSLLSEVRRAVKEHKVSLEKALQVVTSNPANILRLKNKGKLEVGFDADINILEKTELCIHTVIARGKIMVKDKKVLIKGVFEK